jgi:glycyl-tRNA synthetase beta chain
MPREATHNTLLLLEIGTEDLPARFLPSAMQQLKENSVRIFMEYYMPFNEIKTYGTPRRIAVIADGIPEMQEDRKKEVIGPSKKAAFDEQGNPTKAAAGFARSVGLQVEDLFVKSTEKGEYVTAVIEEKGARIREILPEVFKKIVLSINLPKSMRWGDGSIRFARPIRWLMALFNNEAVSFEIEGIKSGNTTRGHRFLSPASFQMKEITSYRSLLANNCVIVDPEERKKIIRKKIEKILEPFRENIIEDEELLDTVANLVEYPVPVVASFSEDYLKLPKELLITVMKGHQKYFAVQDTEGDITNHFIVISNTSEENADTVRVGAERVIRARFEDARFYFMEDGKKPLSDRVEDLKKVTFQERLGSLYDKTERLVALAGYLSEKIIQSEKEVPVRAARLAKADLITGVVREFPELQGVMGKYYALGDGEGQAVAAALEEQYLPAHSGGRLPQTDAGAILSIADKMDSLTAFFSIGLIPSGSEDPFALRRQSLGIIAIMLTRGFDITLKELVHKAIETLRAEDPEEVKERVLKFFENRMENVLSGRGYPSDVIQSVIRLSLDKPLKDILERIRIIKIFKDSAGYNDFLAAIKRVNNIIPEKPVPPVKDGLLIEEPEKTLKQNLDSVKSDLARRIADGNISDAINILPGLTPAINNFFDRVLVMDKNEEIRENRLSLLNDIWRTVSTVADFSKLSAV